ncbi:MAG TPA: DUF4349 domain-containing protein [Candidatus Limnocylindrales bacterium]|nr:DUF4349 domain-containing protein [Candidatus Limnocylindrales bacterium]
MKTPIRGATRHVIVLAAIAAVALLMAACAMGGAASAPSMPPGGGQDEDRPNGGLPAASAAPGAPEAPAGPGGNNVGEGTNAAVGDGVKIIRTGSLQMEVEDVPAALTGARGAILRLGGYIGASQQYRDAENVYATITYRIPADRWEDALDALRRLGTEVGEQTDSADVTSQLVDLDARIRNLKASETALVGYLANATRVEDLLEIESRLRDVRGQIEQLAAQQLSLDDQVAYATLTVTFGTEAKVIEVAAESWDALSEVEQAGASLLNFLQALATFGIWFAIVWLPILLVVAIVVGIGVLVARRLGWLRRPPLPPVPPTPSTAVEG